MTYYFSVSFKYLTDDKLKSFAGTLFTRSADNPDYLKHKPYYDKVNSANKRFEKTTSDAALGGKDRTADKVEAKVDLVKAVTGYGRKLEDEANETGNPRILTDVGFELRNTTRTPKTPVTELDMPTLTAANLTKKGHAKLSWNEVKNAIDTDIRYRKKEDENWTMGNHTDGKEFFFTNLESNQPYEFQICAKGPKGVSTDWTDSETVWVT